ncbi:hypothetical protein [Edaphobacter modestus]|uniref:Uncharacterized protein n=1 Tax=Edaphobacter modestus TaxID=388466 RepID=A0A4Q7XXC0_9BACT|nr:hypothetical protein [Edaphobacter modestus]RZU29012.1 hypothetical protein BDD14_6600 [Edaphobacter modestus]
MPRLQDFNAKNVVGLLLSLPLSTAYIYSQNAALSSQGLLPDATRDARAISLLTSGVEEKTNLSIVHLSGKITLLQGEQRVGTIDVYSSPKMRWREDIHVGGQSFSETYGNGLHIWRNLKTGESGRSAVLLSGSALFPAHALARITQDKRLTIELVGPQPFAETTAIQVNALRKSNDTASNSLNVSQLEISDQSQKEEMFMDMSNQRLIGIRYQHVAESPNPIVPKVCRDSTGKLRAHPAQPSLANLDCDIAHRQLLVPTEVRFADYRETSLGLIPFSVDRLEQGVRVAHIDIVNFEIIENMPAANEAIQ